MSLKPSGEIQYVQFKALEAFPLRHGIFLRHGGVSPEPWASLNVGGTVGDDPARVQENRRRVFSALGFSPHSAHDLWQVHSTRVVRADKPRGDAPYVKGDILITNTSEVTLFMRFADCVPILLYDPKEHAAAMVHAGWKGTLAGAAARAVRALQNSYGSQPGDMVAGIGPSICVDCYPVGEEVVAASHAAFGSQAASLLKHNEERMHLDLWAANELSLRQAGVERIEVSGHCTAKESDDWFSHRADAGRTGRFAALLALRS